MDDVGDTWTIRASPRTASVTLAECVSSMQTAAEFGWPLPRRMASRPVPWIAATMADGAADPLMATICCSRSPSTLVIPCSC
jgi:hypothetical protein